MICRWPRGIEWKGKKRRLAAKQKTGGYPGNTFAAAQAKRLLQQGGNRFVFSRRPLFSNLVFFSNMYRFET